MERFKLVLPKQEKARHPNKFLYVWKLYVHYGQGWEHELTELSRSEIVQRAKEYRENCPQYPIKISCGREPNPEFS